MSSSSELLLAWRSSSSSEPEEGENAKTDASEEWPTVLSGCLGIMTRLPRPTWSLILSLFEVEGAAIIVLVLLGAGP